MRRALWLLSATLLLACEGGPIEIFASAAGASGNGDTAAAGDSNVVDGGSNASAGAGGSVAGSDMGGTFSSGGAPIAGAAGAAGVAGSDGVSCANNPDCPAGWLCKKATCGDARGVCELRPKFCQPDLVPECGCDHVTYWNECYRRAAGQSVSSENECAEGARLCVGNADCPGGAYCQHLLPRDSGCNQMVGPGSCWVTPDSCSEVPQDPYHWKACAIGAMDAGTGCASTCDAVQSGRPYVEQLPNAVCQ